MTFIYGDIATIKKNIAKKEKFTLGAVNVYQVDISPGY